MADYKGYLRRASSAALDWLLPPTCAGCGRLGAVWCAECAASVSLISGTLCPICGLPGVETGGCPACRANQYAFVATRSWAVYKGELRQAILSLKHRRNSTLGLALSQSLAALFAQQDWHVDLVIPIPLSAKKKSDRGYNQVDLLAAPFAATAGLPMAGSLLIRRHETLPQFELSVAQRWENLRGSFTAEKSSRLQGMRVLVVDDIMTTGATLDAAARALRDAGARQVYCLTLARALFEGR